MTESPTHTTTMTTIQCFKALASLLLHEAYPLKSIFDSQRVKVAERGQGLKTGIGVTAATLAGRATSVTNC